MPTLYIRDGILTDPIAAWDDLEASIAAVEERINAADDDFVYTPFVEGTRTATWIMTKAEIQGLEDRLHTIAEYLSIPHISTTWAGLMPLNYNALNHIILALMPQEYIDYGFDNGDLAALMPEEYDVDVYEIDFIAMYLGDLSYDKLDNLISSLVKSNYLYSADYTTQKVYKFDSNDMGLLCASSDRGTPLLCITNDGTNVYAGGLNIHKVFKFVDDDLLWIDQSLELSNPITELVYADGYLYALVASDKDLIKLDTFDMSTEGTAADDCDGLVAVNSTSLFFLSGTKIFKYALSSFSKSTESAAIGSGLSNPFLCSIGADDSYVYGTVMYESGSDLLFKVYKWSASDLSVVASSAAQDYSVVGYPAKQIIFTGTGDDQQLYFGCGTTVMQYKASDLTYVGASSTYPIEIYALATDGTYLYASNNNYKIYQYLDLAKVGESEAIEDSDPIALTCIKT